jgi:hypothetical protein
MKRSAIFRLALVTMAVIALERADGGSAVAMDIQRGHVVYSFGHAKAVAIQRALDMGQRLYGPQVKLVAATDVKGYGAIAVASKGTGSVIGIALGKRSMAEADRLAIAHCLQSGGSDPMVRWRFRG